MVQLEHAQQRILEQVPLLEIESTPVRYACGRIAAEPVVAALNLPPFDNSAMDGYAVRAGDVTGVSHGNPGSLNVIGRAAAGEVFKGNVAEGQCVRLFTGSPLPGGADAVLMQEDTAPDSDNADRIFVFDAVKPFENVRFAGEDLKAGAIVVAAGDRVTVTQLALISAAGHAAINVHRRPVVGLIATGNELREPGDTLEPGQIYESNRITLAALAEQAGGKPNTYPLIPDDLSHTKTILAQALDDCDLVVSSGGVSVGELDLVKAAFEQIGGSLDFWKVAVKPGKPFVLGRRGGKMLFGLPGNPVSAFVTFLLLVRPALLRFQGAKDVHLPCRSGVLAERMANPGDRRHFVRVRIDGDGQVRASGRQASHLLNSLASANGLVDLPANAVAEQGSGVRVLVWS